MRLLHAGHGDGGRSACSTSSPNPIRRGHRHGARSQRLPMRHLSAHRPGDSDWRRGRCERVVADRSRLALSIEARATTSSPSRCGTRSSRPTSIAASSCVCSPRWAAGSSSSRPCRPAGAAGKRARPRRREGPAMSARGSTSTIDGRVTAYTGKVEIGQNIRTSLAQVVADELRVPIDACHVRHGGHRPHAVRSGHVRIADDAGDGATTGAGRGDGARDADRSGGGAMADRSRVARRPRAAASSRRRRPIAHIRRADRRAKDSPAASTGEPAPRARVDASRHARSGKFRAATSSPARTPSRRISCGPDMLLRVRRPAAGVRRDAAER